MAAQHSAHVAAAVVDTDVAGDAGNWPKEVLDDQEDPVEELVLERRENVHGRDCVDGHRMVSAGIQSSVLMLEKDVRRVDVATDVEELRRGFGQMVTLALPDDVVVDQ